MMRTWNLLALMVVLIASPVVRGQESREGAKDKVVERLDKMDQRLEGAFKKIGEDMTALKAETLLAKKRLQDAEDRLELIQSDLAQTRSDLAKIRVELNDLKKRGLAREAFYPPAEKANVDSIGSRLAKIEEDVNRLKTSSRVSLSPPLPGRLRLINERPEEVTFIINGHAYRVAPNAIQVLEQVPTGTFNYEVYSPTVGLLGRESSGLAAGQTCVLRAH